VAKEFSTIKMKKKKTLEASLLETRSNTKSKKFGVTPNYSNACNYVLFTK